MNSPFWGEYWDIPVPTPTGCTYRTERLGNYFGADWQYLHRSEALFANPFRISDFPFPFLFKIAGWEKAATGNARTKSYNRAETFHLERTNMELRIAP